MKMNGSESTISLHGFALPMEARQYNSSGYSDSEQSRTNKQMTESLWLTQLKGGLLRTLTLKVSIKIQGASQM